MADKTGIEWTDATWNPVTGCTKVSQGCKNCYAARVWDRLAAMPNTAYSGRKFTDVQCHEDRLSQPLRWKRPRRIFVNSMSDLFHDAVPESFLDKVFLTMESAQQHTFQILTKRPEAMRDYMIKRQARGDKTLPNVWLGVSVEDQVTANDRIPFLIDTPAAIRWISAEPLLGSIVLGSASMAFGLRPWRLDWVVVGGESGPNARPMHPNWARSLLNQCGSEKVKFLFKQWGEWISVLDRDAEDPDWRADYSKMQRDGDVFLNVAGGSGFHGPVLHVMRRVGKQKAGRVLDGITWDEYPEAKHD